MQVHSLEFSAIGPFAGTHRIDFDGLGGAALFLIDGPTGAGKSTIIDALVFALFGDVAGRTSDRQRLRSAFAAADQETFAEVEFSTSHGRYRVRRTPEYERAKRKGSGTTTSAATVHLSRSTGEHGWESVSTHKGEADAEIQRAIGLTRAQFLQTVVLPQGEFATFLSAESKDRQAVLERIFATDLYSRVESALESLRIDAQRQREAAERAVATAVQHMVSRLSDSDLEAADSEVGDLHDAELVLTTVARIEAQAAHRLGEQERALVTATEALSTATTVWKDASARAAAVRGVDEAAAALVDAQAGATKAEQRLAEHAPVLAGVSSPDGDIVAAIDRLIGSLDLLAAAEVALPGDQARVEADQRLLAELHADEVRLTGERDTVLPARLLALTSALSTAMSEANARVLDAQEREAALVQARLDGMAGELAAGLADDHPCPVCGALDHPSPASDRHSGATAEAIAQARAHRSAVEAERQEWLRTDARLAALGEPVAVVGELTSSVKVDDVAGGIRQFQRDVERLEERLSAIRDQRARVEAALGERTAALKERMSAVEAARGEYDTVLDRLGDLRSAREVVVARDESLSAVDAAVTAHAAAVEHLAQWGQDAPTVDLTDLEQECRTLQGRVREATSARDATAALVSDLGQRADLARTSVEERADVWRATHDVITLANLMRGGDGNLLAQPLSAYVVQRMFDEILEAANRRLDVMLDGRFALKSTEQRTGSARLGQGLGLEVVDQRTDSVRKTATLSGGETFCASLALALGLADTVRANAGGVELGMLFIDEGFGSLDGDRLDEVMAELLRLRSDGRTVGVISHVTEMKKGISERIDVTPVGHRGESTLSVSWAS